MSSRISLFSTPKLLVFRPKLRPGKELFGRPTSQAFVSNFTTKKDPPVSTDKNGPNTDTLPSISEESAAISKSKGEKGPELEQGTPVLEILKRDKEAQEKAPKSIKDEIKKQGDLGKRSFSTISSRKLDMELSSEDPSAAIIAQTLDSIPEHWEDPLPPLKPEHTLVGRYPAIIDQFVGLIMRHGKKGVAQQNIARVLSHLRTSPPPRLREDRPLIPGHPPPSFLPLNPILYLTLAIDSVAPMIRMRQIKGAAGGGQSLPIPSPLTIRQRRRVAFMWIVDSASKKFNRISGKGTFAYRLADEIVAVVEGKSALWDRRTNLHKQGVAARSNVSSNRRLRKRGRV